MNSKKPENKMFLPATLAVVSLIMTLLLIAFILPPINKYQVNLKEKIPKKNSNTWYHDLDNDGYSEKITYSSHRIKKTIITVTKNMKVIGQWNFKDSLVDFHPAFGDFDNNGYTEIYLLTRRNDSIFVNLFEPFNENNITHTRFISNFGTVGKKADIGVFFCTLADANGDGFKEFSFTINAGFSLYPRNLFVYDIKNDTVYTSPQSGAAINLPVVYDLDKDGLPEILVKSYATGNFHSDTVPYTDQRCWLMVFTGKAEFLFEPVMLGEFPSNVVAVPYNLKSASRKNDLFCHALC